MRINELITEIADLPYEYKQGSDNRKYYFTTKAGNTYVVTINGNKELYIEFAWKDSYGREVNTVSNTGDAFRVFATVAKIIRNKINQANPDSIQFSSFKDEPSRIKLYSRLLDKLDNELPDYQKAPISDKLGVTSVVFSLWRNGYDPRGTLKAQTLKKLQTKKILGR